MSRATVENVNHEVLRQCREQIGLSINDLKNDFPRIEDFESGNAKPTFKQIDRLAEKYQVPQWVFIEKKLPDAYRLDSSPAFRHLSGEDAFDSYSVRRILSRVESYRELILDIRNDFEEPVPRFSPPPIEDKNAAEAAGTVRAWLGRPQTESNDFDAWRNHVENKNIFVFLTGRHRGWSKVDISSFRGLAVYRQTLPVIVVNDSDSYKAQSFTLFHELGHLLKKRTAINSATRFESESGEERWCNDFAGNFLMPSSLFRRNEPLPDNPSELAKHVRKLASGFSVSPLACLVRLRSMRMIDQENFAAVKSHWDGEYELYEAEQKNETEKSWFPPRNRPVEVMRQYGQIYTRAVVGAYQSQEISLHKMCKLLDLKRPAYALTLKDSL